ncbi:MAG TPA: non-heme iron oxygenase ferredoxin subunit [Solirubrobacteraceae bacterium]|nr:non-heme iron oxygenase ferredoxin subunit [Solirubrobacteraceae bacterium]
MTHVDVCPLGELPPGARRDILFDGIDISVFNCDGTLYAIEDRCSHDDGPLGEGELDVAACTIACPRHGAKFDLRSGRPLTLPAYEPVETFPVHIVNDMITLEVS